LKWSFKFQVFSFQSGEAPLENLETENWKLKTSV